MKLKGFIAIKTRSIHNSVKKWSERTKSGVKLIVGCVSVRTGGKKNREIIKRAEKQQRDHF